MLRIIPSRTLARSLAVLLAGAALGALATPLSARENGRLSYRSNAYDIASGRYVYSENHTEVWQNGRHVYSDVVYTAANGSVLAKKRITFTRSRTAPDFQLEDLRSGLVERSRAVGGAFQVGFRKSTSEADRTSVVNAPAPAVVDGGFDYFVRENFDTLAAGRPLRGNFVVPERGTFFACRMYKTGETTHNGRRALQLKMEPENVVIRALADPISLLYDIESRRLLVFAGKSNLESAPGAPNFKVRIVFDYPPEALTLR